MAIDNRIVAANISKLRNHRGMTQFQLAAALNVSHQAVSKWETGAALPDIQTLLALTQLFGVSMEELLNTEIVIREAQNEEAKEEANEETPAETFFPGFLNDLIPEEAKNALKNAAGEAKKTFIEVSSSLSNRAGETFGKAVSYAQKAKSDIENRFKAAQESAKEKPAPAQENPKNEEGAAARPTVEFDKLCRMAPFMSREKLSELVLRYAEADSLENIVQIAPFVNRLTVQKLIEKCANPKADVHMIRRLAPFASADALYGLICRNLGEIDWKTLESLAPFLKQHMVDALAEYVITGIMPEETNENSEPKSAKESIKDALEGVMGEIGNVVNEIGNVARSIFTPKKEETNQPEEAGAFAQDAEIPKESEVPQAPPTPEPPSAEEIETFIPSMEETEKFIPSMEEIEKFTPVPEQIPVITPVADPDNAIEEAARHALEAGNWRWIEEHAGEIEGDALLSEIALAAVSAVAQSDSAAIVIKLLHRLTEESKNRLFEKAAEENAWELAVAMQPYASEENAGIIVEKASETEEANREDAYLAIECYAKIAPKDILEKITEKAVSQDNWVLINALTDAY